MDLRREELQGVLETLLGSDQVYFQPPNNITLKYPCIIYTRDDAETKFADNNPYSFIKRYQVTSIDRNPDSTTVTKLAKMHMCVFNRHFVVENLNHDVFSLYF